MTFSELSSSQRWLYAGNLFLIAGTAAISIGHLLALVAEGRIPQPPQFQTGGFNANTQSPTTPNRVRDFFTS